MNRLFYFHFVYIVLLNQGMFSQVMDQTRDGNLLIVGVPGEMTAILGLKLKSELKNKGIKNVAIGGLANEWISYILSRDQYIKGEGYESSVSFYGPDLGAFISQEAIKTASRLIGNE
jgi:neutral ceramidase